MWRLNLALAVVACIGACYGASLDSPVQQSSRFFGTLNRYYISTWDLILDGTDYQAVRNTPEGIEDLHLHDAETVVVVVHGRSDSAFGEFGVTTRNAFLTHDHSTAVILVDWSVVSHLVYAQASAAVPYVAEDLAKFIQHLEVADRLDRRRLHLVGFDLGAHVAGVASRQPTARAIKITALSPAGEGWGVFSLRLRATDAQTVEVIHTDGVGSGAHGITEPIGTLDFFPNGGTGQPGCGDDDHLCFHDRAWRLFAASVHLNGHFYGFRCESMTQVIENRCVAGPIVVMGTSALIKFGSGIYRLNTGEIWPYV